MVDTLPFSKDTEAALLGGCLVDTGAIHRIQSILPNADMLHPAHRAIYQAMLDLADDSTPTDFIAVCDLLERRKQIEKIGGHAYLTRLIDKGIPIHVEHYAGIVKLDYVRREAMMLGARITEAAGRAENIDDLLADINNGLMSLEKGRNGSGPVHVKDAAHELCDDVQHWKANPVGFNEIRGISTGLKRFDELMDGMERGESFVVIGGVTSVGKTALALASAYEMSKLGYKVLFFALEMKRRTLVARLASAKSRVSYKKIKHGVTKMGNDWYASEEEYARFMVALAEFDDIPNFHIEETQNLTMSEIRAISTTHARTVGLDLIVADTGNLIEGGNDAGKNYAQVESDKSRAFRNLLKELDCVGYMTWQLLVKKIEARSKEDFGRVPQMSDFQDTTGILQHASDVIGVYYDALYNPDSKWKNIMHLFGLKRRNDNPENNAKIGWKPEYQQFYTPATEQEMKTKDLGYAF